MFKAKRILAQSLLPLTLLLLSACGGQPENVAAPPAGGEGQDTASDPALFVAHLNELLVTPNRDAAAIVATMAAQFEISSLDTGEGALHAPEEAYGLLEASYLSTEAGVGPLEVVENPDEALGFSAAEKFPGAALLAFGDGWGQSGELSAVVVVVQDPSASPPRYQWGGVAFRAGGASPGVQAALALDDLKLALTQALFEREFDLLPAYFADPFVVAAYQSQASEYGPDQRDAALAHLRTIYPPEGYLIAFMDPRAEGVAMNAELPVLFPNGVDFVFSKGWGPDGQGEVWLVIVPGAEPNTFAWGAILYAEAGFPRG